MINLVLEIVSILTPGMVLALVGLAWYHRGPPFPLGFVTTLAINLGLPALLFHTLATSEVELFSLGRMALATLAVHVVFTLVAIGLLKFAGKDWRLCIAYVVGNSGNIGLPVCYFAFGDEGLAYAIAFFSVQCVLLFSLGDAIYAGSASIMRLFKTPILYAVVLGIGVRLVDITLPRAILNTSQLLGQVVIPIMLITLGVSLAGMRASQLPSSIFWSGVRTACAWIIGFGVAALFELDDVARGILIIETTVPVAVLNFLLAEKHGRDSTEVSGLILVTHLGSIAYLPLLLGILLV